MTLEVNEDLLYNPELSIGEKMICILMENGYSKKEISKALGITIRYVQAVVKKGSANNSSFANNSSLFNEDDANNSSFANNSSLNTGDANNSSQVKTTDFKSESENLTDEILRLFEKSGVNPANFKGIGSNELFSRIRAYDFNLEFDLNSRLHISADELYNILNNI